MNHRNNFDLIRLFAACQVMYSHSSTWLKWPSYPPIQEFLANFPGVAIFFVISGFLVSRSWLNPNMTLSIYSDHRSRRIYPALWVNLIVIIAVLVALGSVIVSIPRFPIWTFITFITGCDWMGSRVAGDIMVTGGFYEYFPSGVLWTIPVELGFYVLVPIIFSKQFNTRKQILTSVALWAAGSLLFHFVWRQTGHPLSTLKYLWIFLIGATVNLAWDSLRPHLAGKGVYWFVAYVILTYAMNGLGLRHYYQSSNIASVIATIILGLTVISVAYSFAPVAGALRGRDISYGVYLWHMPVIWTLRGFGSTGSLTGLCACMLTGLLAWLSWTFIEKPALAGKLIVEGQPSIQDTTTRPASQT